MGIDEQPENAYSAEKRKSSIDLNKKDKIRNSALKSGSDKKHVYSHYEESPNTRSRLDGFASDSALDKSLLEKPMALVSQVRQSLQPDQ